MTFEDFWKRFTELEAKHGLLELRIGGWQLYSLRRVKFFYAVAVALGFSSGANFATAFKDRFGLSPREFRAGRSGQLS